MKMNRRFNAHAVVVLAALNLSASPSLGFALVSPSPALAVTLATSGGSQIIGRHHQRRVVATCTTSRYSSSTRTRSGENLLNIRGGALSGGADNVSDGEMSDADVDIDEVEDEAVPVNAEVVDGPWSNAAASAPKLMSDGAGDANSSSAANAGNESQKSSYFLSSLLWLSLVMDCVLNKAKRAALLASSAGVVAESAPFRAGEVQKALFAFDGRLNRVTAVPTAALAGGYALAAGVAFLLSRSPARSKLAADDASDDDEDGAIVASNIRKRLAFGLVMFGILNLAAGATGSPYLGIAGNVINGHNALIALNGWSKDVAKDDRPYVSDLINGAKNSFRVFIGGGDYYKSDATDRLKGAASAAFLLATFSALARSVQTAKGLLLQRQQLEATATVLSVAHLARLVLASSTALSLKEATDAGRFRGLLVLGLGILVSICSAFVAIPMMVADAGMRKVSSDAGKLLALGLFSGGLCLSKAVARASPPKAQEGQ